MRPARSQACCAPRRTPRTLISSTGLDGKEADELVYDCLARRVLLPNVCLRVVPCTAGLHPGLATGAFTLLHFPPSNRDTDTDIVYVSGLTGELYLDKPHEVQRCREAHAGILGCALDRAATQDLCSQLLKTSSAKPLPIPAFLDRRRVQPGGDTCQWWSARSEARTNDRCTCGLRAGHNRAARKDASSPGHACRSQRAGPARVGGFTTCALDGTSADSSLTALASQVCCRAWASAVCSCSAACRAAAAWAA